MQPKIDSAIIELFLLPTNAQQPQMHQFHPSLNGMANKQRIVTFCKPIKQGPQSNICQASDLSEQQQQ